MRTLPWGHMGLWSLTEPDLRSLGTHRGWRLLGAEGSGVEVGGGDQDGLTGPFQSRVPGSLCPSSPEPRTGLALHIYNSKWDQAAWRSLELSRKNLELCQVQW